jgi:WD40 repeat protein
MIVFASETEINSFDPQTMTITTLIRYNRPIVSKFALCLENTVVAVSQKNKELDFWELESGECTSTIPFPQHVTSMKSSPDGSILAVVTNDSVVFINTITYSIAHTFAPPSARAGEHINSIAFSSGSDVFIDYATVKPQMCILNLETGHEFTLSARDSSDRTVINMAYGATYMSTEDAFVTGLGGNLVSVIDRTTGTIIKSFGRASRNGFYGYILSPDETFIVVLGATSYAVRMSDEQHIQLSAETRYNFIGGAFSDDGLSLVVVMNTLVYVYETAEWTCVQKIDTGSVIVDVKSTAVLNFTVLM